MALHGHLTSGDAKTDLCPRLQVPSLLLTPMPPASSSLGHSFLLKKILLTGAFLLVILEIINKFYREVTSIMRQKRGVGRDPSRGAGALLTGKVTLCVISAFMASALLLGE